MCWKTEAGLFQSVGEIKLEVPNEHPVFLQNFRYAIFKDEKDMLGLTFHAVCIDFVLDSKGTTPSEACKGLKNHVYSFIDATLSHATDKSKAYCALIEQKENRDETRELIYRAYNEVLAHNETILYAKLRPYSKNLYDSVSSKPQNEILPYKYSNLYAHAYSEEDIENLYKQQKLTDDKVRKIVAFNYYLFFNNMIRQNRMM
jgi:hypothetical protein